MMMTIIIIVIIIINITIGGPRNDRFRYGLDADVCLHDQLASVTDHYGKLR